MVQSQFSRRAILAAGIGGLASTGAVARAFHGKSFKGLGQVIAGAVAREDLPFAVAMVAGREGILWEGAVGYATAERKAALDTAFRIFSMTKAIGTLSAMILVDRNKVSLDTPVAEILPEFAELQVIDSVRPSGPLMRPPKRPATLRHLLTHTSGLAYTIWNQKEYDWENLTNAGARLTDTKAGFMHPLVFDPGENWAYGMGIDWAGFLVEKVDGRRIDRFVTEEILSPLGMSSTKFEPDDLRDRLAVTRQRNAKGGFTDIQLDIPSHPEAYGMGQALYSTAPDYLKFLQFLLIGTGTHHGHRISSPEALRQMKLNQIGAMSVPAMLSLMPDFSADVNFFPGVRKTWSFGFLRNEADIPGRRRAGSLTWAGLQNTHFWIDPSQGITAVLMTQSLPFVEPRFMQVYGEFERHVYESLA